MKNTNKKIVSISLSMLVFATAIPVAEAINIDEKNANEIYHYSSTKYFMIGLILLDWDEPHEIPFIWGFWTIAVLCITFQNDKPVGVSFLGPHYYIDFNRYICEGYVGLFIIRAFLTKR